MSKMTPVLSTFAFCLLALAGTRASAESCNVDTDCPQSFACVVSGTSTAPGCKGTGCPADAAAPEPVVYKDCQPKPCATDAECGTGMVCYELKTTSCTGGGSVSGCAANTKCDAGPVITTVDTCTTTSKKLCAFKWQLPCSADTDCGDGFVCQPSVSGGCGSSGRAVSAGPNGTAGGTSSGASSSPPAVDAGAPECQTTTSFPGSCTPKATTCMGDSECPGGWTCTVVATPQPVTGAGTPTPIVGDVFAAPPADGVDAGGAQTKICVGPLGAAPTRGGVDVPTDIGTTTNSGHQGSGGTVPPASPAGGATGGTTGASASSSPSAGGCAVAPARAGDSALMLLGVAIVGLALVRRRHRK